MTFVKICGITRLEDARAAVAHGTDAIGFVFWPGSPRHIEPAYAREIVAALDGRVVAVGVFVNQAAEEVNEIADVVGLRAVQLHGDETPDAVEAITRPVIKAVTEESMSTVVTEWPRGTTLLVDAHDRDRRGGTGRTTNWAAAAELARHRRVMLAGGLTPENVDRAVAEVRPFGIDVSSGVETSPGVKDEARISALFRALAMVNR